MTAFNETIIKNRSIMKVAIPKSFLDLIEAEDCLNLIIRRTSHFLFTSPTESIPVVEKIDTKSPGVPVVTAMDIGNISFEITNNIRSQQTQLAK
jgi:hypothetical protein